MSVTEKNLDPKVKSLLDMMAAMPSTPIAEMDVRDFRALREQGQHIINPTSPDLALVKDVEVEGADGFLKARIYDTDISGGNRPTLVYYHGGGFVYGDLESHDPLCRRLAHHGDIRVIAIDYRLAPEHKYPAAVEDAIASLKHITTHTDQYGVDVARLAIGGDSAGGCLAAIAAREAARSNIPLKLQLLIYPVVVAGEETPTRLEYSEGYFLTKETMDWFESHYIPPNTDFSVEWASPLRHAPPEGLAPAYILTAGFDPLLHEGQAYAELLRDAGISVEYIDYPTQIHGFCSFTAFSSDAEEAIKASALAAAKALKA